MKRFISILLVLFLAVSLAAPSINASAASKSKKTKTVKVAATVKTVKTGTKFNVGNLKYKVTKVTKTGGTVAVTGVKKKTSKVKIPSSFKIKVRKGKYKGVHTIKVTAIASKSFMYNMNIQKLVIGSNVKSIGEKAFFKAMNLRTVRLGKNVTKIGTKCFMSDYNLVSVFLPKNSKLKTIGKSAFRNCLALSSFNFAAAKNLTNIGEFAFTACERLKNIPTKKASEYQKLYKSISKYSYSISPILPEMNIYFYFKTNNPNADKLRLVDKSSVYYEKGSTDYDILSAVEKRFCDVSYVDKVRGKVKGGYIFETKDFTTDGGELTLQAYTDVLDPEGQNKQWVDTGITVKCPKIGTSSDYLLNHYTKPGMTFWEKLDGIERGLSSLSLYPKGMYDNTKRRAGRYACLCTSPYAELSLNEHYESIYEKSDEGALFYYMYPYIMDSLGFPGTVAGFARKFAPNCTISNGGAHYIIKVTYKGETHYYGGAGNGTTDEFYKGCISKYFTFDGSSNDLGTKGTLEGFQKAYGESQKKSAKIIEGFRDQLSGSTFSKKIGNGTWIKAGREGSGGVSYVYITKGEDYSYTSAYPHSVSDIWVDGRYINDWNFAEKGTSFSEHPTSAIMIRNMAYTNYFGESMRGDVTFYYDKEKSCWTSDAYFTRKGYGYGWMMDDVELPDEFILTLDEVKKMNIDGNKDSMPSSGLIYDGTVEPGTPFNDNGNK